MTGAAPPVWRRPLRGHPGPPPVHRRLDGPASPRPGTRGPHRRGPV